MKVKEQLFCDYFLGECNGNATQAAINAGYSPKCARQTAYKLLKKPQIKEYLDQRNDEIASDKIATITEIHEFWTHIMRDEDEVTKNRIRASELLGKAKGMFSNDW